MRISIFTARPSPAPPSCRPRWKRCVEFTNSQLGEALGRKYVERVFPPEAKAHTLEMVHEIEAALGQDLQSVTWMSPATKQKALDKLHAVTNKIGYPDKWRDYSSIVIRRDDAFGNATAPPPSRSIGSSTKSASPSTAPSGR